jgi:integrase
VKTSLNVWVIPQWGEQRLSDVRTVEVEGWLRGLALANATKAKVRNVMHSMFAHACRHEWLTRNPISLVRQSAKRTKVPDVLDAEELRKLLAELRNPARAVVFLTAATGLRISEALGLKWSHVDFSSGVITFESR